MTPKEAFSSGGRNPEMGFWVNDWHCYGCIFTPQGVMHEGEAIFGMRVITAMDIASGYMMSFEAVPRSLDSLRAIEIIPFLDRVCSEFCQPREGVVISHSCWLSSLELQMDDDISERAEHLAAIGAEFGPMSDSDKTAIAQWGLSRGIKVLFDADQLPQK